MTWTRGRDEAFSRISTQFLLAQRDISSLRRLLAERKYDPDQPRVPPGSSQGGQWSGGHGGSARPLVKPAFFNPQRHAALKTLEAALAFYTWLSTRNSDSQRTIVEFGAREFGLNAQKEVDLDGIRTLRGDEIKAACPRFGEVQSRTDAAVDAVRNDGLYRRPAEFGTAVHHNLKKQVEALNDPTFIAEKSYIKGELEGYGRKDTIRVDVLEDVGDGTVCVYDIKTGLSGLSVARRREIASNVFGAFPHAHRFIVTEVRPRP